MDGIIVVDKPAGMTSHDVCFKLRRMLGEKSIGHTGTLDPIATGVMVVVLGKATRLCEYITAGKKRYTAGILFGKTTDSCDITGNVIDERKANFTKEEFNRTIKLFLGEIKQYPPVYSAVRVNGKHLYEYARSASDVEIPQRSVSVHNISIVSDQFPHRAVLDISCSKGTYIRSLCRDIGERLGCGAVMDSLRRTENGEATERLSFSLERIKEMHECGDDSFLLKPDTFLNNLPKVYLSEDFRKMLSNGNYIKESTQLSLTALNEGDILSVYLNKEFAAIAKIHNQGIKPVKVFL